MTFSGESLEPALLALALAKPPQYIAKMHSPQKHHFLPVFYLKQWADDASGRIVEFSAPYKNLVKPKRVHPEGTGYIHKLYAQEGLPPEAASRMESDFFSPVDSRAADALHILINGHSIPEAQRRAWATFIASLMCRMPQDVEMVKNMTKELTELISPLFRRFYEASKPADEPSRFDELTEQLIASSADRGLRQLERLITHQRVVEGLCAMHWALVSVRADRELLTSDRPVIYTNVLGHPESHVVLPVGPQRLFVAVHDTDFLSNFQHMKSIDLVDLANTAAVEQANRYAYGRNDDQLDFVQDHLGQNQNPQLIERLIGLQRQQYPAMVAAIASVPSDIETLN